jgi:hypothetical protein
MNRSLLAIPLLAALAIASPARAAAGGASPFQLALVNPVQIVPEGQSIEGVRLSLLYGKNANVTGFDWSFIATHTTGSFKGVQLALVNVVEKDALGLQWGGVNLTGGLVHGAQLGFFNKATRVEGLQLGFVNYAGTIHGLQLGLVNIIEKGGWLPVMVIVNGNFG